MMLSRFNSSRLLWPTVVALGALAVLLGLGTWQLQRKVWKDGLQKQIDVGVSRAPVAAFTGDAIASLGLFRRGVLTAELQPGSGWTLCGKIGDMFAISCCIIAVLTLIFPLRGSHGIRIAGREDRGA